MIIYGRNPVREALRGKRRVYRIWATRAMQREPWLAKIAGGQVDVTVAELEQIASLSATGDHQGVCAEVSDFEYADGSAFLAPEDAFVVVLDEVQDPRNLGAVARVAEVAGCTGLVLPQRRSAEVTPVTCKASAGAVEHLPIARATNIADYLTRAKDSGAWIYGAAAEAVVRYTEPDYSGKVVLVMGSEGKGLRTRVASSCDALISLPVRGKVGSLNVSAAAAVLVYWIVQDRVQ